MAPPRRPWFRFYVEAVHDRKLRRLKPEHRWLFVACLAAARQSPAPGRLMISATAPMDLDDLADFAGMARRAVEQGMSALVDVGVIAFDAPERTWSVPAWTARQFESDDSTPRATRSRSKATTMQRPNSGDTASDATPPEAEADTEAEAAASNPAVERELNERIRRRRARGEDIGPGLVALIRSDVERDLAQPDPTVCTDCTGRFFAGSGWTHKPDCPQLRKRQETA